MQEVFAELEAYLKKENIYPDEYLLLSDDSPDALFPKGDIRCYAQWGGSEGIYMTTSDKAWEIDFDTKYDIYKNLAMHVELSYIKLDFDEATWGSNYKYVEDDDAYKAGIYLTYKF